MVKILISCPNGAGTSLMATITAEKVVKMVGLDDSVIHHCPISEGKSISTQFDLIICPINFAPMFKEAEEKGVIIVGLRNVMSQKEMSEKIISSGILNKQ
ncbi:MAG: PTS ascorbate transporter subunit IIB [Clostridiales bacterium]|jgi:PTS system ascorbate-specific IIB component|nr:PTS ascorbate transporter subunit IIB [Clostridiales bacterium]